MLTFKAKAPRSARTVQGTLADIILRFKIKLIEISVRNFASTKSVILFLTNEKNLVSNITLSENLSRALRNKELTFSDLASMVVVTQKNKMQQEYEALQFPEMDSERKDITTVLKDAAPFEPATIEVPWEEYSL